MGEAHEEPSAHLLIDQRRTLLGKCRRFGRIAFWLIGKSQQLLKHLSLLQAPQLHLGSHRTISHACLWP